MQHEHKLSCNLVQIQCFFKVVCCISPNDVVLLLFEQDYVKRQTRFVSRKPAKVIISSIEAVAESMGLKVHSRNYKVSLCNAYLHSKCGIMLRPKTLKLIVAGIVTYVELHIIQNN
jgi:hypothetical protein